MTTDKKKQKLKMLVEKDVSIPLKDGAILSSNIFRPNSPGVFPVVMAMGAYGKDVHFRDAYKKQWKTLKKIYPEIDKNGSTGRYIRWENVDPERWVPDGYVVITVQSRGTGKSPGYLDPYSPQETADYAEAINWAGQQPWSNGRVGLLGVSYFATKQWQVAALKPKHLAAIIPWEGCNDFYREWGRHGGIRARFPIDWWPRQILPNQHGNGNNPYRDASTGRPTNGPVLNPQTLSNNRTDFPSATLHHPLEDDWYLDRTPDFDQITVPLLSAANWGGSGLHLRGNVEGFLQAKSQNKWLSFHIGTHYESFYLPKYVAIQKKFFDKYLKNIDNGWETEPAVRLEIRTIKGTHLRKENTWPLSKTEWQKWFLDAETQSLSTAEPDNGSSRQYLALEQRVSFSTSPFNADTEFTGPLMAHLKMETTTTDLDIFVTLRLIDSAGKEVTFLGAHEVTPVTRGWLRASQRHIDPARSTHYRPYHTHDRIEKLLPGQVVSLYVEIWPTSIICPKNYRLVLTVQGHDFEYSEPGRMLHDDNIDRPPQEFGGINTIHTGGVLPSFLLLPYIP